VEVRGLGFGSSKVVDTIALLAVGCMPGIDALVYCHEALPDISMPRDQAGSTLSRRHRAQKD
jgi:hypothetical protein